MASANDRNPVRDWKNTFFKNSLFMGLRPFSDVS